MKNGVGEGEASVVGLGVMLCVSTGVAVPPGRKAGNWAQAPKHKSIAGIIIEATIFIKATIMDFILCRVIIKRIFCLIIGDYAVIYAERTFFLIGIAVEAQIFRCVG